MAICPNCGNQTGETAVFCDQCGTRLPQPEVAAAEPAAAPAGGSVICPACGAGNVPGEAFCDFCGTPLDAPVPSAEPVPEMEPVSSAEELEIETAAAEGLAPGAASETAPEATPGAASEAAPPEPPVAAEEAPPAEEPAAAAVAVLEEKTLCPACGADVLPGEAFCANCGASLAQGPISPEPEPEVEPELEGPPTCPACGTEIEPGDTFCSTCGFALKDVAPVPKPAEEVAAVVPPAPVTAGPRLVLADSGAEIPLPAGEEILVGREDPVSGVYPDIDLTPHGGEQAGVSRRHARLIVESGSYFVEDLDSTNFTFVNKQKLAAKTRQPVGDGDEIRFGRIATVLRLS